MPAQVRTNVANLFPRKSLFVYLLQLVLDPCLLSFLNLAKNFFNQVSHLKSYFISSEKFVPRFALQNRKKPFVFPKTVLLVFDIFCNPCSYFVIKSYTKAELQSKIKMLNIAPGKTQGPSFLLHQTHML